MSYTILIVDDSATIRAMVKKAIDMSGLDVDIFMEASNGMQAMKLLDEYPVDLVLADIHMPEMNGVELVEEMSDAGLLEDTRVVMLSSDRSEEQMQRVAELGVDAYLTKPFRPELFRDVVFQILGIGKD